MGLFTKKKPKPPTMTPQNPYLNQGFVVWIYSYYFLCPPMMYHTLRPKNWHWQLGIKVSSYSTEWDLYFYKQHKNANSTNRRLWPHTYRSLNTMGFLVFFCFLNEMPQNIILRMKFCTLFKLNSWGLQSISSPNFRLSIVTFVKHHHSWYDVHTD